MSNLTRNHKNRSQSKFLGARRKSFFTKRTAKIGFNFIKANKGTLTISKTDLGAYRAVFNSKATGRKAFAYGSDFDAAYQRLIRLFHLKYAI